MNLIERARNVNTLVKKHGDTKNRLLAEKSVKETALNEKLRKISELVGYPVTRENLESVYKTESQKIEQKIQLTEQAADRLERQLATANVASTHPVVGGQAMQAPQMSVGQGVNPVPQVQSVPQGVVEQVITQAQVQQEHVQHPQVQPAVTSAATLNNSFAQMAESFQASFATSQQGSPVTPQI